MKDPKELSATQLREALLFTKSAPINDPEFTAWRNSKERWKLHFINLIDEKIIRLENIQLDHLHQFGAKNTILEYKILQYVQMREAVLNDTFKPTLGDDIETV